MSAVEQPSPPKGQKGKLEEPVSSAEGRVDIPTEHSRSDSKPAPKEDPLQVLVDADDEQCLIEEAIVLNTKEVKTKEVIIEPPAIPKRNTLRTSRLLDSLRLDSIESATKSLNTTHNIYLSSEEDASSSADEYSDDDDYESSSEEPEQTLVRRKSQEVTARVVSVVFVGKPCMVELASSRRSGSPVKRPQSEFFGRSVSSSFGTASLQRRPDDLPRKVSLTSVGDLPKESPSFLSQDPFSSSPYTRRESALMLDTSSGSYPRARTPTGAFQRIQKTISLVRKRSRPNLKAAAENSASTSSVNLTNLNTSQESQASINKPDTASPATVQSPVTYNQILKAARRNSIAAPATASTFVQPSAVAQSQPASPINPSTTKRGILNSLNMNRRRSMKIKI
ncbi:hypothetical protein F5Y14DRAFT_331465 [Nemania sp. NC0429]|nr:hypothetical protein F5Y14DRAFT_331465 [Nemania sp. NC0429]